MKRIALLLLIFFFKSEQTVAQFTGVWQEGTGKQELLVNMTHDDFLSQWKRLSDRKMRLVDVSILMKEGKKLYSGVFQEGSDAYYFWTGATYEAFKEKFFELRQKMELIDIEVHKENGELLFTGVWREGKTFQTIFNDLTFAEIKRYTIIDYSIRLKEWAAYEVDGKQLFVTVWDRINRNEYGGFSDPKKDNRVIVGNWETFTKEWENINKTTALKLVDLEITKEGGQTLYHGLFKEDKRTGYYLWAAPSLTNFQAKMKELEKQKLRLVDFIAN